MNLWESIDWLIFIPMLIIVIFGVIILLSIDSFQFPMYFLFLLAGFFLFFLFSQIDYRIYKSLDYIFYFFCLLLLIITFVFGSFIRGSTRWLNLGFISIQTSELIKPFLIISFASLSTKFDTRKLGQSVILLALFLPFLILVFLQPDFGNTFIFLLLFASVFYTSGGSLLIMLFSSLGVTVISPVVWFFLKDYQRQRVTGFLNPSSDPLGIGYNLIQSVVTVGSGKIFGRGLGVGTQSSLRFLPERSTDFIFASTAEEIGFIGCLILILVILFLLARILFAGFKTKDRFGAIIILTGFMIIFSQSVINIGMNLGLLPITGVTLPLVSQGGSSLLATMIILGIISNISSQN